LDIGDAAFDRRLRDEVLPAHDDFIADPALAVSIDAAFDGLEARYQVRKAAKNL